MVGKKKRGHPDVEDLLARPWCYYCERDFDDLKILISHQKAKHFKCERCGRRLNTAGGLAVHMNQVHKETLASVDNSLPNRAGLEVEIFGMEGIPEDVSQSHNQRIIAGFYQQEAERRAATGNPTSGTANTGQAKKPKFESPAELKRRLAEHKARKAEQAAAGNSGGNTPMNDLPSGQSPVAQSPGIYNGAPYAPPPAAYNGSQGAPYGSFPQDSYSQPPATYQQSFPTQPTFSGPPGSQFPAQYSPPQQYQGQQSFAPGFQPPQFVPGQPNFQANHPAASSPGSFNGYQAPASHTPPQHGSLPNRPPSLPPAPGLPQRPSFGATVTTPGYQMHPGSPTPGQAPPHQQGGWSGNGWNGQDQKSVMSPAYPPHPQGYNGSFPTNASSVDDLVSGAAREADDIDMLIRMAEAGIKPPKKDEASSEIAAAAATADVPKATPIDAAIEPKTLATEKKAKKEKSLKMTYSDNEFSPEEMIAKLARYAFNPDGMAEKAPVVDEKALPNAATVPVA